MAEQHQNIYEPLSTSSQGEEADEADDDTSQQGDISIATETQSSIPCGVGRGKEIRPTADQHQGHGKKDGGYCDAEAGEIGFGSRLMYELLRQRIVNSQRDALRDP